MFLDVNFAPLIGMLQIVVMFILLIILLVITFVVLKKVNLNNDDKDNQTKNLDSKDELIEKKENDNMEDKE